MLKRERAVLALEDGTVYRGYAAGKRGETVGEVVFNTSMTGYQEIMTDPSYNGQIVCMTYPHIGNYGITVYDMESNKPYVRGFVAREFAKQYSNFRATDALEAFTKQHGVVSIEGIDTRALVRRLRQGGVVKGVVAHRSYTHPEDPFGEFTPEEESRLVARAKYHDDIDGRDMMPEVTTQIPYVYPTLEKGKRIVFMDFGIKHMIIKKLAEIGAEVIVVPASTTPAAIMALHPQGLFLSNGPGDPSAPVYTHDTTWKLLGLLPTFGICLGHQILGLSVGGKTFKLKYGHRGGNQPVKNLINGKVEITSQNHGYAVDAETVKDHFMPTHINLNDNTLEGMAHLRYPVFSVQYHPEASPGPHDSFYLFQRFIEEVNTFSGTTGQPVAKSSSGLYGI
jgi:carbamoyl-phosphate synthase small subunit